MQSKQSLTCCIRLLMTLVKYKVSLAVSITTIIGYLVFDSKIDLTIVSAFAGVFLLAGAASIE